MRRAVAASAVLMSALAGSTAQAQRNSNSNSSSNGIGSNSNLNSSRSISQQQQQSSSGTPSNVLGTSNNDNFFLELIAGASATVVLAHNLS
jgi:hypothetical protein